MNEQDKPRPRAPTLAGVGPSSAPAVVGAVGRPSTLRPSEVTSRMIFEPAVDAELQKGSPSGSLEEAGIDDQWPDEPPTVAPVQLVTLPPAAPVPATARTEEFKGVERARRGNRWVAVAVLALAAGGAGLRAYWSGRHPVASLDSPMAATAVASTSAAALAPPAGPASSGPPVPAVEAAPPPAPAEASPASAFDPMAAKRALHATASAVARCQKGKVSGPAHAIVTFGNDGSVLRSAVSPPYLGTPAGMCVARALAQARVPAFAGRPGVVIHHFGVSAE